MKPALMERLRVLYAQPADHGEAIAALEARLQEVDADLLSMLESDLESDGGSERHWGGLVLRHCTPEAARAEASLVYVPSNFDCVHGPFCAQVIASLAERMLYPGEWLEALSRIEWARPIRRKVDIEVTDGGAGGRPDAAIHGSFETSRGRRLVFVVRERPGDYVVEQTADNRLARLLLGGAQASVEDGVWRLPLDLRRLPAVERERLASPGGWLGTVLDLLSILTLNLQRGVPMLACSAAVVPLPGPGVAWPETLELQLRCRREGARRSPRSGLTLVPYAFRCWPLSESWSPWRVAEAAGVEPMLRVLHER